LSKNIVYEEPWGFDAIGHMTRVRRSFQLNLNYSLCYYKGILFSKVVDF